MAACRARLHACGSRTSTVSPSTATTRLMYTLSSAQLGRSLCTASCGGWKMMTSPGTGDLQASASAVWLRPTCSSQAPCGMGREHHWEATNMLRWLQQHTRHVHGQFVA